MKEIRFCQKRDGSITTFDKNLISNAITKAFKEANEGNRVIALKITETIVEILIRKYQRGVPTVEDIQDIVENTLMDFNFNRSAKCYILYREKRNRTRVTI